MVIKMEEEIMQEIIQEEKENVQEGDDDNDNYLIRWSNYDVTSKINKLKRSPDENTDEDTDEEVDETIPEEKEIIQEEKEKENVQEVDEESIDEYANPDLMEEGDVNRSIRDWSAFLDNVSDKYDKIHDDTTLEFVNEMLSGDLGELLKERAKKQKSNLKVKDTSNVFDKFDDFIESTPDGDCRLIKFFDDKCLKMKFIHDDDEEDVSEIRFSW